MSVSNYLKQNVILDEIVGKIRENYKNYGRLHGKCIVENPSDELRFQVGKIIGNILKPSYRENGPLEFNFSTFFRRLNKINGSNEEIAEVLQEYFGSVILTKPERLEKQKMAFEFFVKELRKDSPEDLKTRLWCEMENRGRVYGLLKSSFKENPGAAAVIWTVVENMWGWVINQIENPAENLKLVMVSDMVTKDPHGLDRTSLYRRIFLYLLAVESGREMPKFSAEGEQEFLASFNIYTDFVSSFVSAYNMRDENKDGNSLWGAFADTKQPINITLANVLAAEKIVSPGNILIVENPSVFESLCPHTDMVKFALICTHGNLNVAAVKLLEGAIKTNPAVKMYYNGDYDLGGITIANRMLNRFGGNVSLVHYDKETYESISSCVMVHNEKLQAKIAKVHPALREITEAITNRGVACYQESIVEKLIQVVSPL